MSYRLVMDPAAFPSVWIAKCSNCGAACTTKKDLKRFERRHPALCTTTIKDRDEKQKLSKELAQGTRSVETFNDATRWTEDDWLEMKREEYEESLRDNDPFK